MHSMVLAASCVERFEGNIEPHTTSLYFSKKKYYQIILMIVRTTTTKEREKRCPHFSDWPIF